MKISIITVVFNGEKTIERSINSVLSQKNIDLEYIVIDGLSQDNTTELIKPYQKYLTHFISEKDAGIYDAMNKGLRLAKGDVIGFLNADDIYVDPTVLSRVMREFLDPALDAVYGDLEYFRAHRPNKVVRRYRSSYFKPSNLAKGIMPAHPTLFLRRNVYEQFGIYDPVFKIAGDFELVARIFRKNTLKVRYLPRTMVRMQMGGISTRGLKSNFLLLKENLHACKKNGISTNYLNLMSRYPRKILEYFFRD